MLDVVLLITLTGELDVFEADQLRQRFPEMLENLPVGIVLVDLSGVTFLDAAGARVILWVGHQAFLRGHQWGIITGGNGWVHRVFRLLGWADALPLYSDWDCANQALRGRPG